MTQDLYTQAQHLADIRQKEIIAELIAGALASESALQPAIDEQPPEFDDDLCDGPCCRPDEDEFADHRAQDEISDLFESIAVCLRGVLKFRYGVDPE